MAATTGSVTQGGKSLSEVSVAKTTRMERGVRLYFERGHEITPTTAHTYRVPACSGIGTYIVHLDLGCCSCVDSERRRERGDRTPCKHLVAASILASKRRAARRARRDDTLDTHFASSERLH